MALEIDPPQPPTYRLPSACHLHPYENFTGFCTSCLRERLSTLDSATPTTAHRNSTSTISSSSLLKSNFFKPPSSSGPHEAELRRCKSFSCGRGGGVGSSTSYDPQRKSCDVRGAGEVKNGGDEITTAVDPAIVAVNSGEIEEVKKPMKDQLPEEIDLESQQQTKKPPPKDLKEIAGSFWMAASVFSKKLQKWRRKQKLKKMNKKQEEKPDPKSSSRRFRETQSEVAVDAFGRRSCDLDPRRFSLDAGLISFDDPRYSFEEPSPRASWDGYLIGTRPVFPQVPPMLAVVEDSPTPQVVQRFDSQIPVEEDATIPGGSAQTKDYYYSDSLSRSRRRSLDRSNSVRKSSFEMNEPKPASNAKVSPAINADFFFREWSSTSFRDDRSESFDSAYRDDPHKPSSTKKSKRWSKGWNLWGFIHRRNSNSSNKRDNVVERSFSESWPNGFSNGYANGKLLTSNSNLSSRSLNYSNGGFGSMRKVTNGVEKKRKDEFVLERNRSARLSPGHTDNGMLRFYLTTPMRGSRRVSGKSKSNSNAHHSFTRSVLGLY